MNLRILKKLSKRAAPLLILLGDVRDQYSAEKGENHTDVTGHDFKHWDRMRSVHDEKFSWVLAKYKPRHGKGWVSMQEPSTPLKGTVMVGRMSGYYEPEWVEQTAWEALCQCLFDHYTDYPEWDLVGEIPNPVLRRDLSTPSMILRAARDAIAEIEASRA